MLFSPAAHEPARHRSHVATPPLPCMVEPSLALALTRIRSTLTKPDRFTTRTGSHSCSPLHHWTETTTPSPARRPNPPIAFDESTLNRDHLRLEKPPHPLLARSARHLPPLSIPSPLQAHTQPATFSLAVPSPSKLAGEPPKPRKKRGRLPSNATPLASLLSLSGFLDLPRV
jgi:hypothetical protein